MRLISHFYNPRETPLSRQFKYTMSWLSTEYRLLGLESNLSSSPLRITAQILLLQCFYYLTALIIFYLVASLNGFEFTIDWVFSWELISPDNTMGLTLFALWLFDSLLCVLFVTLIVGRSKLAWDFAVTVHVLNLLVVWLYTGKFPSSLLWWCLQILSGVLLVTLSTYSTRWKELRTTFFDDMLDRQERGEVEPQGTSIPMKDLQPSSGS